MNADRLLALYDRVAEAPDAIAHLRRFVLNLAVRGKLVEQNPADEPASELLKRITAEKARLVKAGKIRKPKHVTPPNDFPFAIPLTWQWTHFGNIVYFSAGRTPSRNETAFWNTGDFAWVSIADMKDGKTVQTTKETVSDKARFNVFRSEPEAPGTMIMSFKLTIGKIARLNIPAFHNEAIISIRPHLNELDQFLFKVLPNLARGGDTKAAIKGATLNRESVSKILIPLPPLAEQHRIVAKVDELMALFDRLEEARIAREDTRDRLTQASLARLSAPDTDDVTFRSHACIALDALPALTARDDQVKHLRQAILNLAVRGKLTGQDHADEPADQLLTRARAAKRRLIRELHIRRDSPPEHSATAGEEGSPDHWCWAYLHDFSLVLGGKRLPAGTSFSRETTGNIYIRITDMKNGTISDDRLKYISSTVKQKIEKYTISKDDLYVTIAGTIGIVGDVPEIFDGHNLTENAAKIVFREVDKTFLKLTLQSMDVQEQFAEKTKKMAQPKLALKRISGARVPLPPLAEQHRIVAKVDEFMAVCDRLEATLSVVASTRARLLKAVLHDTLEPIENELWSAE